MQDGWVSATSLPLTACLQKNHPTAEVLEELRGSVVVDLANVGAAITQKNIEGDTLRPPLIAAITKADDKTLWDEALTLTLTANHIGTTFPAPQFIEPQNRSVIATQTSIPSINVSEHQRLAAATISPGSTVSQRFQSPSKYTTGSVASSSERRKDINLLKQKLKGRLDIDTPGFLGAFFSSSDFPRQRKIFSINARLA
ncbi:hypothetical protein E4U40_003012 [Claviceps sp. LM458 group G5]|nr:hypothetical protein E4U40_003012 [Claviceps sp. LM458 group G5]